MSKNDAEGGLRPGSTERQIDELLDEIRASGEDVDASFIDLDAEQLPNSTDMLHLDEGDPLKDADLLFDDSDMSADETLQDIDLGAFTTPLEEDAFAVGEAVRKLDEDDDTLELGDFVNLEHGDTAVTVGVDGQSAAAEKIPDDESLLAQSPADVSADSEATLDEIISEADELLPDGDDADELAELSQPDEVAEESAAQLLESEVAPSGESLEEMVVKEAASLNAEELLEMEQRSAEGFIESHIKELEQQLLASKAAAMEQAATSRGPSSWLGAVLGGLAVLLSGAALWFSLETPMPEATPVAASDNSAQLRALKSELATLRKRLGSVESKAAAITTPQPAAAETQTAVTAAQPAPVPLPTAATTSAALSADKAGTVVKRVADKPVASKSTVQKPKPQSTTESRKVVKSTTTSKPSASSSTAKSTTTALKRPATTVAAAGGSSKTVRKTSKQVFVKGWAVNLRSFYRRADAELLAKMYQEEGIDAEIREVPKEGATWHRVRVMGFVSKKDAEVFIDSLTAEQGRELAWASYYEGYVDR